MARAGDLQAGRRRLLRRRPAGLVVIALATCLGAASALAAIGMISGRVAAVAPPLSIRALPASRTVAPGESTRFTVRVSRDHLAARRISGRTDLSVSRRGLPTGARTSFAPERAIVLDTRTDRATTLTVATASGTPAGTYLLRIRARRPHRRGFATVRLVVGDRVGTPGPTPTPVPAPVPPAAPPPVLTAPDAFAIAGDLAVPLTPGSGEPLDLVLTNRADTDLSILELNVAVAAVDAPGSSPGRPCGSADFAVEQFSGAPGFALPVASSATLGELGFDPSEWPRVSLRNRPLNQDGCKLASLTLAYAGTAQGGTP